MEKNIDRFINKLTLTIRFFCSHCVGPTERFNTCSENKVVQPKAETRRPEDVGFCIRYRLSWCVGKQSVNIEIKLTVGFSIRKNEIHRSDSIHKTLS